MKSFALNRQRGTFQFTTHKTLNPKARRIRLLLRLFLLFSLLFVGQNLTAAGQPASPTVPAAVGDNALSLPGVRPEPPLDISGYVEVPYSAALNPSGGLITIEAWVKRVAADRNETIVGNGWQTSYWFGFSESDKLRFIPHGSGSMTDSDGTVLPGVWTHVAVTYDGITRRFYINGILDKVDTDNAGPITPAAAGEPLGIGFDREDNFLPNY